jgi:hypothetical protein
MSLAALNKMLPSIINAPELRWMCNPFSGRRSLSREMSQSIIGGIEQVLEEKQATEHDPRPAMAGEAMAGNDIFGIQCKPLVHRFENFQKQQKRRGMMIWKRGMIYRTSKDGRHVRTLGKVVNFEMAVVTLVKKLGNVLGTIPIVRFKTAGRESHRNHARGDVRKVKINSLCIVDEAPVRTGHQMTNKIRHPLHDKIVVKLFEPSR